MNKSILWRHHGTARAISMLLLLIGLGLTWWAHNARRETLDRFARLDVFMDRIATDAIQTSEALQALSMDLKSDLARKHARDAQINLTNMVDSLQAEFPDGTEIISAARTLQVLHGRILEQMDSDPARTMAEYRRTYSSIQDDRLELLRKLDQKVEAYTSERFDRATARDLWGATAISLILLGSVLAMVLQSVAITRPLGTLAGTVERMRRGNLTQRIDVEGAGPFRELGDGLNRLAEWLSIMGGQVHRSGLQVHSTAIRIASTAREQQTSAAAIAASSAEIGAASKQISTTSKEIVRTIDEVSRVAEDTAGLANAGQAAITRMEVTMRQIMEASGTITAKLTLLSEKSANINSVVTAITKVADQTNLLSLNAAIEAEKAGEYGLGFAVVAMEIRRLADQTAVATYDIEKTVKEMQSAAAAGVMGMDKFSEEVRSGVGEFRQVSLQLVRIIQQVQSLLSRFETVNEGMHAQASGTQEVSETLAQLGDAARQAAESLHQSNLAIEQLNDAVRNLQTSVVPFKLET
jgi:methyl-accepting chemotaxis protein WspA